MVSLRGRFGRIYSAVETFLFCEIADVELVLDSLFEVGDLEVEPVRMAASIGVDSHEEVVLLGFEVVVGSDDAVEVAAFEGRVELENIFVGLIKEVEIPEEFLVFGRLDFGVEHFEEGEHHLGANFVEVIILERVGVFAGESFVHFECCGGSESDVAQFILFSVDALFLGEFVDDSIDHMVIEEEGDGSIEADFRAPSCGVYNEIDIRY